MLKQKTGRRLISAAALAAACLLLTACGALKKAVDAAVPKAPVTFAAGTVDASAAELRLPLARGETALLSNFPALRSADLSGSEDEGEIAAWALEHPEVETIFTVTLPDGRTLDSGTRSFDMSGMSAEACVAAAERLALLPGLKSVRLGAEGGSIDWECIARLRAILPETAFKYRFALYGKECDLSSSTLNLSYVTIDDGGAALRKVLPLMPALSYLDLDSCGLSNRELEKLRADFPELRIVWRVWFSKSYSVRTDVQRILASKPSVGGMILDPDVEALSCCHEVVFLDLGHNKGLTDISFVAQMPKLEVAILAMCDWTDASPLAQCPELEYLEMQTTLCTDLSPLSGLKKLRHLNIANIPALTDISPLFELTELKRLWLGCVHQVPAEQVEEFRKRAPNCEVNTTVYEDPTSGEWRYDREGNQTERYYLLRIQFGYYENDAYSFSWNDKLCREASDTE